MQRRGNDASFIFTLARSAGQSIAEGYYRDLAKGPARGLKHRSLKDSVMRAKLTPLLGEIKFTSPAEGKLRPAGDVKKIARSLRQHRELILNYFRAQKLISSGVVEGLNNKAKVTMRKSYGFRTYGVLELALYHSLGKLPEPESTHDFF